MTNPHSHLNIRVEVFPKKSHHESVKFAIPHLMEI